MIRSIKASLLQPEPAGAAGPPTRRHSS